jgi:multidrug transporter EmrE-like cation transporter
MGAISIVGGSLIGVFVFGNRLQMGEWFLLAAVIILFGYRWLANA